jgi:hypothetical protein
MTTLFLCLELTKSDALNKLIKKVMVAQYGGSQLNADENVAYRKYLDDTQEANRVLWAEAMQELVKERRKHKKTDTMIAVRPAMNINHVYGSMSQGVYPLRTDVYEKKASCDPNLIRAMDVEVSNHINALCNESNSEFFFS